MNTNNKLMAMFLAVVLSVFAIAIVSDSSFDSNATTVVNLGTASQSGDGWSYSYSGAQGTLTITDYEKVVSGYTFNGTDIAVSGSIDDTKIGAIGLMIKKDLATDLYSSKLSSAVDSITVSQLDAYKKIRIVFLADSADDKKWGNSNLSDSKDFTTKLDVDLDLGGFTYTTSAMSGTVVSTKAMSLYAGQTWTIHNGTMMAEKRTVANDTENYISYQLMQTYGNVTLEDLVIDISNVTVTSTAGNENHAAAVFAVAGELTLGQGLFIYANDGEFAAMDAGMFYNNDADQHYASHAPQMTIDGAVLYGDVGNAATTWRDGAEPRDMTITIDSGIIYGDYFQGIIKRNGGTANPETKYNNHVKDKVTISGGIFGFDPTAYVTAGNAVVAIDGLYYVGEQSESGEIEVIETETADGTTVETVADIRVDGSGNVIDATVTISTDDSEAIATFGSHGEVSLTSSTKGAVYLSDTAMGMLFEISAELTDADSLALDLVTGGPSVFVGNRASAEIGLGTLDLKVTMNSGNAGQATVVLGEDSVSGEIFTITAEVASAGPLNNAGLTGTTPVSIEMIDIFGQELELRGEATLSLPYSESHDEAYMYCIETGETFAISVSNGTATATVPHFSTWSVVYKDKSVVVDDDDDILFILEQQRKAQEAASAQTTTEDNSGEEAAVIIAAAAVAGAMLACAFFAFRRP